MSDRMWGARGAQARAPSAVAAPSREPLLAATDIVRKTTLTDLRQSLLNIDVVAGIKWPGGLQQRQCLGCRVHIPVTHLSREQAERA